VQHSGNGADMNTGAPWWYSLIGPIVVSVVIPVCKFGVQEITAWYARRVTARLYRSGLMRDRRQSRPNTYHTHKREGE